jgi:hypothetical protein
MKKMKIRIDRKGKTKIQVEGGSGTDCLDFTRSVEDALGVVEERELLEEYSHDELKVNLDEDIKETESL